MAALSAKLSGEKKMFQSTYMYTWVYSNAQHMKLFLQAGVYLQKTQMEWKLNFLGVSKRNIN